MRESRKNEQLIKEMENQQGPRVLNLARGLALVDVCACTGLGFTDVQSSHPFNSYISLLEKHRHSEGC